MLALTCERAQLADGQQVLELGCGWGSLTLWMAAHYPQSRITAVSNSASQRRHILERARTRGLGNVQVLTADMAHFRPPDRYDRVVSVEMFEHMRNWPELLRRIRSWMQPGARALVHVFCHRTHSYLFETGGRTDWMGRYFFTGGMMPAESLMLHCQDDLRVRHHWRVNGRHYARTLRAWLENMDARRPALLPVLAQAYGETDARRWFGRWRLFMMACEELFAWRGGTEWYVAQYLLAPRETSPAP
jgi:cyclopropane-fatty-acyl-phospholipid synthase